MRTDIPDYLISDYMDFLSDELLRMYGNDRETTPVSKKKDEDLGSDQYATVSAYICENLSPWSLLDRPLRSALINISLMMISYMGVDTDIIEDRVIECLWMSLTTDGSPESRAQSNTLSGQHNTYMTCLERMIANRFGIPYEHIGW